MLIIRPAPASDEPRRQQPHEAREADELDARALRARARSARSKASRSAKALCRRQRWRCRPRAAAARPAASGRLDRRARSRPDNRRGARAPRSAPPCWSRGRRSGSRPFARRGVSQRRASPRCGRALRRRALDDRRAERRSRPRRAQAATIASAGAGLDHDDHADAAIEGAQHLGSATPPVRRQPAEDRRHGDGGEIDARPPTPSGSTRGMLSGKPPPVMWASALMPRGRAERGEQRLDIDARRRRAAPRRASAPGANGAGVVPGEAARLDDPAHQREAVGVHARRGEAEDDVARPRRRRAAAACRARRRRRRSRRGRSRRLRRGRASRPSRRRSARSRPRRQPSAMPSTMAAPTCGSSLPVAK